MFKIYLQTRRSDGILRYNSLFIVMPATYDAFQVVVSDSSINDGFLVRLQPLMPDQGPNHSAITFQRGPSYNSDMDAFSGRDDLDLAINKLHTDGNNQQDWEELSPADCAKAYESKFYQKYSSVVVVVNDTETTDNNTAVYLAALAGASYGFQGLIDYCPTSYLEANLDNFTKPTQYTFAENLTQLCQSYKTSPSEASYPARDSGKVIQRCISQKAIQRCTVVTPILFWRFAAGISVCKCLEC